MAGDNISIDPRAAAQILEAMSLTMRAYIQEVNTLGSILTSTAHSTQSNPLNDSMQLSGQALTNTGHATNESIFSFATALKGVIDLWRQSDAHAGQAGDYTKPGFDGVQVPQNQSDAVNVSPNNLRNLMAQMQESRTKMDKLFQDVQGHVNSAKKWSGASQSIAQTTQTFNSKVMPLNQEVNQLLQKVHGQVDQELIDFIKRDMGNHVQ